MTHSIPKFLFLNMEKAFVRATTFTTKKGKKVQRKAYVDKRIAKKYEAKDKIRMPSIQTKSPSQVRDELHKTRDELKEKLEEILKHKEELKTAKSKGDTHTESGIHIDDGHHINKHHDNLVEKLENANHKLMLHENRSGIEREKRIEAQEKAKKKREEKKVVIKKETKDSATFGSEKEYMDWYRKQSDERKDDHKLTRTGGKLIVTWGAKPKEEEPEKKMVVVKKEKPKEPSKSLSQLLDDYYAAGTKEERVKAGNLAKEKFMSENPDANIQDYIQAAKEHKPKEEVPEKPKVIEKKKVVVKKEEKKPFSPSVGDIVYIHWLATKKDEPVNYRGKEGDQAVIVKDGSQMMVPFSDLKPKPKVEKKIVVKQPGGGISDIVKMKPIKTLHVIKLPSGKYGYVGEVPAEVGYIDATPEKIEAGQQFGGRFGPKSRSFDSREDAVKFAKDKGYDVSEQTDSEEYKNRSEAMKGNKNAYKGGPKEEPKKVVVKKEEEPAKIKILSAEEIHNLSLDDQKKYFGEISEKGYSQLREMAGFISSSIDEISKPEKEILEDREKKLREKQLDLKTRKVRRNANEYKKFYDDQSKLLDDKNDFERNKKDLKAEGVIKIFPALKGVNRSTIIDMSDRYHRGHADFVRKLEDAGFEIGLQNKRDFLMGDQKNWLTDKAIATTPAEYAKKLGISEDVAKELPRAFGQHLLSKYSGSTFYQKPNTNFDELLKDYWQKNKARHSGRGIDIQKDDFRPKVSSTNHHDYSNDDHSFILPDLSTTGFMKFSKRELAGEGHETVKRAVNEFEDLKKSIIKSENLERDLSSRGYRPSEYKIDGGYQIVNGRIFMRVTASTDKYIYRKDKEEPKKRPKTRKSFIYSPDVQLGTKGIVELKGGYKAEMEMQRTLYNQINHKSNHTNDLLTDVKKIGGTYGAHDFFQKAEYNENTGMIESEVEGNGKKISASFPLERFKMMLSFFNAHDKGGLFSSGYVVPEKNLTRSVRDALEIHKADQSAHRERMSSTYYEAYLKGRETSFGKANVEDDILDSHGVLIKRQNGEELSESDKTKLENVVDETYKAIGNKELLSKMAKDKSLKVSYSGEKMAFLTKAMGLYVPTESTVVIGKQMDHVLPHEFAHFMDDHLGDETKKGRGSYASEMPHTTVGRATIAGRKTFTKNSKRTQAPGGYWNRSCEIFARMVEQYAAIEHYKNESYFGKDGYWTKEKYQQVKPEIESVLKEKFGKSFFNILSEKQKVPKFLFFKAI